MFEHRPVVCIVEAEKSAVILSELYPQYIWLAAGGMNEVQVNKFIPLQNYRIILCPDTDPEGRAYKTWYNAAQDVMRSFFWPKHNPIRVSPFLELHATPDQKQRKIDLVDFIFEVCDSARTVSCSHEHCRAQADSTEGQHGSLGSNG